MNFSDADQTDVYSGLMKGLVYVSGNLSISKQAIFEGTVVVGGNTSISDITTVTFNSVHKNYPPPGFSEGAQMRIVPGTWRRIAAP
jgi:UDP-3-O-[3-hydroxymyristoyl] glucosamine N-acyltransferase